MCIKGKEPAGFFSLGVVRSSLLEAFNGGPVSQLEFCAARSVA